MSLLALIAAHAAGGPGPDPDPDPPGDTTPYEFPTIAPYNAPVAAITPTYDGSGQTVHPGVVDFLTMHGQATWNGYRYWMGVTPYPDGNASYENPSILASHDGYTWVVPAGLTNPIAFPTVGSNSDTDLVYDPATGRLWCYWREYSGPETIHTAWSTNGTTWTNVLNLFTYTSTHETAKNNAALSPAVVRFAADDWRMVTLGWWQADQPPHIRYATAPTGPWSAPEVASFTWTGTSHGGTWHFGMTRVDGVLYGLVDIQAGVEHVFPCTSLDGKTWQASSVPVIEAGSGGWDNRPYRSTLTPHENGTHMRVWYSASNDTVTPATWATGYTQVPLTAWPDPPA